MGREGDLVPARLARGCLCFAVWIEGALGGFGWLSTGPEWIGEIQLEIKPREREAYIWNCVTIDEHRRKGVFRSVVIGISLAARRLGARRIWIGSVAIPAEKALGPLGFRPGLRFYTVEFGGLHVMRAFPGELTLARSAYAVLSLHSATMIRRSRSRRH